MFSKKSTSSRQHPLSSNEIRELSADENAGVNGGAYLRGDAFATYDASYSGDSFRTSTAVAAESLTTLGCIDTDDGTIWGCPKVTI